jgi:hypothetical protein
METIKEPTHPRRLEKNANITHKIGAAPPGGFHIVVAAKELKPAKSKDMIIFKRTTYRYEEGAKFALFTFKNDELDSKERQSRRSALRAFASTPREFIDSMYQ